MTVVNLGIMYFTCSFVGREGAWAGGETVGRFFIEADMNLCCNSSSWGADFLVWIFFIYIFLPSYPAAVRRIMLARPSARALGVLRHLSKCSLVAARAPATSTLPRNAPIATARRTHAVLPASASSSSSTVDAAEVEKFSQMSATWWDPLGPFRPLHNMNPIRTSFIAQVASEHFSTPATAPLSGLRVLDVGSGGGLLCEALARLGPASVKGVDASPDNVAMARTHAAGDPTLWPLSYAHAMAESLVAKGEQYDLVTSVEVIEHVSDPSLFAALCLQLVRPGGLLVMSTINRSAEAYAGAILAAEHILRWVPPGTHEFHKFITPFELQEVLRGAHRTPIDAAVAAAGSGAGTTAVGARTVADISGMVSAGMIYRPIPRDEWVLSADDLGTNYIIAVPTLVTPAPAPTTAAADAGAAAAGGAAGAGAAAVA